MQESDNLVSLMGSQQGRGSPALNKLQLVDVVALHGDDEPATISPVEGSRWNSFCCAYSWVI